MTNHMNSPKIKKALEAYRAAKAEFDVKQAALVEHIEHNPIRGLSWEESYRRDHLTFKMKEAQSAKNVAEWEASTALRAYYKGKLSNREIMNIVATALL